MKNPGIYSKAPIDLGQIRKANLKNPVMESIEEYLKKCDRVRDYWRDELIRLGFKMEFREDRHPVYLCGPFTILIVTSDPSSAMLACRMSGVSLKTLVGFYKPPDPVTGERQAHMVPAHISWEAAPGDEESLHFLRCLTQPELLPTCVGIAWAGDLIETWMRGQ